MYGAQRASSLATLDHATARTAVHLASTLGIGSAPDRLPVTAAARHRQSARHHLQVPLDGSDLARWSWRRAQSHDRRAFLRGVLLARGSLSFGSGGAHLEMPLPNATDAEHLRQRLLECGIQASLAARRGRKVVYLKSQEAIASLLRLTGANRGLLDLEARRVGREVRNRLNRLLNAEEANLARSVAAADRQLRAIDRLEADGQLAKLPSALREAAVQRRLHPDAGLEALAAALGVSRSAANHRLRRLVELADGG
jgi:DNA-binding protein WhiA